LILTIQTPMSDGLKLDSGCKGLMGAAQFLAGAGASAKVLKAQLKKIIFLCVLFYSVPLSARVNGLLVRIGLGHPRGNARVPRAVLGLAPKSLIAKSRPAGYALIMYQCIFISGQPYAAGQGRA
jgi:hypothetical protein